VSTAISSGQKERLMWLAMSILHTSAGLVDVAAGLTV